MDGSIPPTSRRDDLPRTRCRPARKAREARPFAGHAYPTCSARPAAGTGLFGVAAVAKGPRRLGPPSGPAATPISNQRPRESSESRSPHSPGSTLARRDGPAGIRTRPFVRFGLAANPSRRCAATPARADPACGSADAARLSAFVGQDHGSRFVVEWLAAQSQTGSSVAMPLSSASTGSCWSAAPRGCVIGHRGSSKSALAPGDPRISPAPDAFPK